MDDEANIHQVKQDGGRRADPEWCAADEVAFGPISPRGTGRRATALRRGPALPPVDEAPHLLT
jgi:hypothetical protein